MEKISSKRYPLDAKRGFTLIELLVVMAIILILAGLITGAAQKAKQRAMVAQARTMISGLETALGMFQSDLGGYPSSPNSNLVNALVNNTGTYVAGGNTYTLPNTSWAGPYMNFKQGDIVGGVVVDPWNRAYTYNNGGANHSATGGPDNTKYFDLWSNGPDGISGNADDISNWMR